MGFARTISVLALAAAAAACGQGNSGNVMSPEANALQPADVNAALGPEVTNTTDLNATANELNGIANDTNMAYPPDEPAMTNNSAQ
jgi:hypothetical protein